MQALVHAQRSAHLPVLGGWWHEVGWTSRVRGVWKRMVLLHAQRGSGCRPTVLSFTRTLLQLQIQKKARVPELQIAAAFGALCTGREAAALKSLVSASICKELVQRWGRASSTKLRVAG